MGEKNNRTCITCGQIFEKAAGAEFDMCPKCLKQTEARYAAPVEEEATNRRKKPWAFVLCAACAAVIAFQAPRIKAAVAVLMPPPPEDGASLPDPKGQCMDNLWHISGLIQQNKWPSEKMACPFTRIPYDTRIENGDLVVRCPNPGAHSLKALRVSRKSPTPQIVD